MRTYSSSLIGVYTELASAGPASLLGNRDDRHLQRGIAVRRVSGSFFNNATTDQFHHKPSRLVRSLSRSVPWKHAARF